MATTDKDSEGKSDEKGKGSMQVHLFSGYFFANISGKGGDQNRIPCVRRLGKRPLPAA